MKKGRETLLTLLEAFVYDPLVDWTVGGEGLGGTTFRGVTGRGGDVKSKQSRKDLEQEVTLAMFHVRCAEMKADWNKNKGEILSELQPLLDALNGYVEQCNLTKQSEDTLRDLHQQMALIKEAEVNQRHPLHKLPGRYAVYRKIKDAVSCAQQNLEDLRRECESHLKRHGDALKAIRSPAYGDWASGKVDGDDWKVFELVKEFLQNAGQTGSVAQCEQSENETHGLMGQLMTYAQSCLAMLSQYGQLAALCPASHADKHMAVRFARWIEYLLEARTKEACEEVFAEFNFVYGGQETDAKVFHNIVEFNCQLQIMIQSVLQRIKMNCERLAALRSLGGAQALEKNYQDGRAGISSFLRAERGGGAARAYEFVVISELCSLNKQYLVMETTARSAGSYLVTLTSRDGDWFLDEMLLMSGLIVELVSSLSLSEGVAGAPADRPLPAEVTSIVSGLRIANSIYRGLQELNFKFHTVILPEAMSRMQCEDRSVVEMVRKLDAILEEAGAPLDELVVHLEKLLTLIVLKMDEDLSQYAAVKTINRMRNQYRQLLHAAQSEEALTPGEMLLMGFDGLFENLNRETSNLIQTMRVDALPHSWRKVDQVRDAKALAAPIYDPKARTVLDHIFLVKRLQTMREFFALCAETAVAFKGGAAAGGNGGPKGNGGASTAMLLTDEQLSKPIKTFTADYVSRQFLGIKTEAVAYLQCLLLQHRLDVDVTLEVEQRDVGAESKVPLEDVCKRALERCLKGGAFTANVLAQASGLCGQLAQAWRKREVPRLKEEKVEMQNATMTRLQAQLTGHCWLHEAVLGSAAAAAVVGVDNHRQLLSFKRSGFLLEMRGVAAALASVQPRLLEARQNQKALIASVEQRLRWAAGANPDLLEVAAAFADAIALKHRRMDRELEAAARLAQMCNTVVQHEALAAGPSSQNEASCAFSQLFLDRLEQWREACVQDAMRDAANGAVTDTEDGLMRMCADDGADTADWLRKLSARIGEAIKKQQLLVEAHKIRSHASGEAMYERADGLKGELQRHGKLMQEVRSLLRALKTRRAAAYLAQHRAFVDGLSVAAAAACALLAKDATAEARCVADVVQALGVARRDADAVFEGLFAVSCPSAADECAGGAPELDEAEEEAKGGEGRGRRNAYAVGVWKRVRMKLEGRDPDPGRRSTVQEQVDFIINEATDVDNLALLYEGWTPWV